MKSNSKLELYYVNKSLESIKIDLNKLLKNINTDVLNYFDNNGVKSELLKENIFLEMEFSFSNNVVKSPNSFSVVEHDQIVIVGEEMSIILGLKGSNLYKIKDEQLSKLVNCLSVNIPEGMSLLRTNIDYKVKKPKHKLLNRKLSVME